MLNSGVKLDACGVCNGTNSSGGLTESKYTLKGSGTFGKQVENSAKYTITL